jgi:hypothetical protein
LTDKREKTVSYRRAEWLTDDPKSMSLSGFIKQASDKLTTVDERTITRDSGQEIKLASLKASRSGFLLHFTVDTPGESASIVPKAVPASSEIEIETAAPPLDAEFMDGDAFLFVKGNDVCLCSTGMRDGAIKYFLKEFFKAAKLRKDAVLFNLAKVSDVSKIKLIQKQGIKEVEIRAALFEATMAYNRRKTQAYSVLGAAAKQMKAIFGNPHDVNNDALRVMLTIKKDKRRKGLKLGEKRIQELASDVVNNQEEGDEFIIVTNGGQRIGPNEIFMRSTVAIDSMGKSVQRDKAWKELQAFYDVLDDSGALEQ